MPETVLFFLAGIAGGVVNAAAGGAKLFVFPMFLAAGLPPVAANATATVAIWPAQIVAAIVHRKILKPVLREAMGRVGIALMGGLLGALLLLRSSDSGFMLLVPGLLALATLAIALGKDVRRLVPKSTRLGWNNPLPVLVLFLASLYGGYFGAGLGFMLIAVMTLSGTDEITDANALKNLLAAAINTIAVVPIALSGIVHWSAALTR